MKNFDKKKILILTIIAVVAVFGILKLTPANDIENIKLDAGYNLQVVEAGSYSGPFVEDATDEKVSNVMMIKVKNCGDKPIQYGEIAMTGKDGETAMFKFSTLKEGQTLTVLESTRKKYKKNSEYEKAVASNVAYFQNKLQKYTKSLEIQPLDGGLNVTNISDKDIDGEILIYFKDKEDGEVFGGITYRGRVSGGLKAGEIRQLMSSNFTAENTEVVFITIDGK